MVLAGAVLLCLPAFWNRFPLMYSDTGAYLATAFENKLPLSRPTGYGLFIRYTSLGGHLRLTLLAQGLLLAGMLWRAVVVALPACEPRKVYPLALGFSLGLTGMAWYTSQLMPDFMTGLVALAFFLLLYDRAARWWGMLGYGFLAFWFCFSHYSHSALLLGLCGTAFVLWLLQRWRKAGTTLSLGRVAWAAVPAFLAVFAYCYVNASHGHGWRTTRSSHVFTMARLSETGLLRDYLHETCPERQWSLCPYADSLPRVAADFIWRDDSPFKKTGYWENSGPQYDSLLSDFFSRGTYLRRYAMEAVKAGTLQMMELAVGEGLTPYTEKSSPYKFFERRMPEKLDAYRSSRQFGRVFDFSQETALLYIVVLVSMAAIVMVLALRGRGLDGPSMALAMACVVAYVLNAFVTGAFANVYSRLQARISWLIPLAFLILLANFFVFLKKKV